MLGVHINVGLVNCKPGRVGLRISMCILQIVQMTREKSVYIGQTTDAPLYCLFTKAEQHCLWIFWQKFSAAVQCPLFKDVSWYYCANWNQLIMDPVILYISTQSLSFQRVGLMVRLTDTSCQWFCLHVSPWPWCCGVKTYQNCACNEDPSIVTHHHHQQSMFPNIFQECCDPGVFLILFYWLLTLYLLPCWEGQW